MFRLRAQADRVFARAHEIAQGLIVGRRNVDRRELAGGELDGLAGAQPVKAQVSADNGQIEAVAVQRLASGVWRVAFVVTPKVKKAVDLRCYLTLHGEGLTETWVYQWTP